jgi:hypothetical protein
MRNFDLIAWAFLDIAAAVIFIITAISFLRLSARHALLDGLAKSGMASEGTVTSVWKDSSGVCIGYVFTTPAGERKSGKEEIQLEPGQELKEEPGASVVILYSEAKPDIWAIREHLAGRMQELKHDISALKVGLLLDVACLLFFSYELYRSVFPSH